MWDDEQRDPLEELGPGAFRSLFEGLMRDDRPFFDVRSRSLRPLWRIRTTDKEVIVTMDLPYVERKDIDLTSTESTLYVVAAMRKPVTLRVGGIVQKRTAFERYITSLALPARVNPSRARATFRNGLLRVRFPIAKTGTKVKIG